ncbi:hypothetical protein MyNCGM70_02750 [Achromobacter xylosoxidans]|nr:hypothetical protein A6J83_024470 [Achromobacter xylosoxidans]
MGQPLWSGPREAGESVGVFRPDFERELIIWRPILAGHISLDAVRQGHVDLLDILKLNALMDAQEAQQAQANRKDR